MHVLNNIAIQPLVYNNKLFLSVRTHVLCVSMCVCASSPLPAQIWFECQFAVTCRDDWRYLHTKPGAKRFTYIIADDGKQRIRNMITSDELWKYLQMSGIMDTGFWI